MRLPDALQDTRFITQGFAMRKPFDFIVKNSYRRGNGAIKGNEAQQREKGERGFDF